MCFFLPIFLFANKKKHNNLLLPDEDTISVVQELKLPQSKLFMIDNASFEEIDMETIADTYSNCNIIIKGEILNQQNSFNYNKANIDVLLSACQQFDSFDCCSIKAIYLTNKKLLKSLNIY